MCLVLTAGFCAAALHALERDLKGLGMPLLTVIFHFLASLSPQSRSAATAALVAADGVEVTVRYLAEAGCDMHPRVVDMLITMMRDPAGQERICVPETVHQLVKGFAEWLLQVR
jgi:hypothetical protein